MDIQKKEELGGKITSSYKKVAVERNRLVNGMALFIMYYTPKSCAMTLY